MSISESGSVAISAPLCICIWLCLCSGACPRISCGSCICLHKLKVCHGCIGSISFQTCENCEHHDLHFVRQTRDPRLETGDFSLFPNQTQFECEKSGNQALKFSINKLFGPRLSAQDKFISPGSRQIAVQPKVKLNSDSDSKRKQTANSRLTAGPQKEMKRKETSPTNAAKKSFARNRRTANAKIKKKNKK